MQVEELKSVRQFTKQGEKEIGRLFSNMHQIRVMRGDCLIKTEKLVVTPKTQKRGFNAEVRKWLSCRALRCKCIEINILMISRGSTTRSSKKQLEKLSRGWGSAGSKSG